MLTTPPLSEALRTFLQNEELPLRRRTDGRERAAAILRYGAFVGSVVERHPSLDRAMEHARTHITALENRGRSVASGTVIIADRLGSPRGRFARAWHAPVGGLWGCLIHVNTLLPQSRRLLSLAVGVACCEAIRQEGAPEACLRWVNDVLIHGRKAAGFLLQGCTGPLHGEEYDLIGFGINLNNRDFPPELADEAISLTEKTGSPVDLRHFTLVFLAKLAWNLGLLYHEEAQALDAGPGFGAEGEHRLLTRWRELSDTIGRRVVYGQNVVEMPLFEAAVVGVAPDGGLMLRLDDGSSLVEHSGEIRYRCSSVFSAPQE